MRTTRTQRCHFCLTCRTWKLFTLNRTILDMYYLSFRTAASAGAFPFSHGCFKLSVLRVETGRYMHESNGIDGTRGIPIQMRVCKYCDLCKVEDEIHFLLECSLYHTVHTFRKSLLTVCSKFIDLNDFSVLQQFIALMSNDKFVDNIEVIQALANYIWSAFQLRSKSLNAISSILR